MKRLVTALVYLLIINGVTLRRHMPISGIGPRLIIVTVYESGSKRLAAIYSDDNGTALPNPFVSDWQGKYIFYAPNGRYDIVFSNLLDPVTPNSSTKQDGGERPKH